MKHKKGKVFGFVSAEKIRNIAKEEIIFSLKEEIFKAAHRGDFSYIYNSPLFCDVINLLKKSGYRVEDKIINGIKGLEISWNN